MRNIALSFLIATSPIAAAAEMASYELDPEHTTVFFTIEHIGYADTLGIFGNVQGIFDYDTETQELANVQVAIDAKSVNTFNKARDGHVKNKDFLHVSEFPEITFVAESGTAATDNAGTVTGDLTILGVTQPVTLNVTLNKAEPYPFGHKRFVLGLSIEASIKRSDYGMTYAVENGLVGDLVNIKIETEAMRIE
ncbi:YceI family protein [Ruegeria lacuscaerulensis]|uniref:YceI family protein n=1 Tax=Ruegeria lacuscaerulensis TaxID=55218 RepID=UPI00147C304C|nr:YceI family protein [Ruegeria lacuscaerulensis]